MPGKSRTPTRARRAAAGALLALLAACAGHDYEVYVAELDGALEGVATPARGRAIVLVSRDGDRAEITLSISGFQSPILGAFIRHAPRGQAGGVVLTLWRAGQEPLDASHPILRVWDQSGGGAAGPGSAPDVRVADSDAPFDAAMLEALRSGNLYVNVQTRDRPSGEVRGQLLPE